MSVKEKYPHLFKPGGISFGEDLSFYDIEKVKAFELWYEDTLLVRCSNISREDWSNILEKLKSIYHHAGDSGFSGTLWYESGKYRSYEEDYNTGYWYWVAYPPYPKPPAGTVLEVLY